LSQAVKVWTAELGAALMSLEHELSRVVACDSRYPIDAYIFALESLEYTRAQKKLKASKLRGQGRARTRVAANHVTGAELCRGACELALSQYGLLAHSILSGWGVRRTADLGNIIYNMINSGELEKTESDAQTDFEEVLDLDEALRIDQDLPIGDS
jgi:uncharacterized repeat protein (TIGR04138 family)